MICICMDHKWFTWDDQGLWRTHREEWWERWPNQGPTEPGGHGCPPRNFASAISGQSHGVARCSLSALSPRSLHSFGPIPVVSESHEKLLERLCTSHHGIWWNFFAVPSKFALDGPMVHRSAVILTKLRVQWIARSANCRSKCATWWLVDRWFGAKLGPGVARSCQPSKSCCTGSLLMVILVVPNSFSLDSTGHAHPHSLL